MNVIRKRSTYECPHDNKKGFIMEKMKAAIFKGNGVLKVEEVPVPKIERDDQILIKVRAASI